MRKTEYKIVLLCLLLLAVVACAVPPSAILPESAPVATPTQTVRPTVLPSVEPTQPPTEASQPDEADASPRKTLLDQYLPRHQKLAETENFVFYAQDGYFPVDLEYWKARVEEIYDYVSRRVGAESPVKISLAFQPAQTEACPIRGLASSEDPPVIILFADPGVSETYLLAVISHEVGHAIPARGFEGGLPNDIALTEGLASWASGKYWNAWQGKPGIHHLVKHYIESGIYLPLTENVDLPAIYPWQEGTGEGCLARRDQIYSQWASFLDYLIRTYGWDKVRTLFETGRTEKKNGQEIRHPTNYEGVVGKSLPALEEDWLAFIQRETQHKRQAMLHDAPLRQ